MVRARRRGVARAKATPDCDGVVVVVVLLAAVEVAVPGVLLSPPLLAAAVAAAPCVANASPGVLPASLSATPVAAEAPADAPPPPAAVAEVSGVVTRLKALVAVCSGVSSAVEEGGGEGDDLCCVSWPATKPIRRGASACSSVLMVEMALTHSACQAEGRGRGRGGEGV